MLKTIENSLDTNILMVLGHTTLCSVEERQADLETHLERPRQALEDNGLRIIKKEPLYMYIAYFNFDPPPHNDDYYQGH